MMSTMTRGVIVAACVVALASCGSKNNNGDEDATDVVEEDTSGDGTTDAPDGQPDVEPEPAPDIEEDAEPDAEEDSPLDVPEDWPTDIPADWETDTSSACAAAGGFCTAVRWEICPAGYEPIDPDPHRGCGGEGIPGWCCVVAPYSTCSASGRGNCVPGTSCTGCWGPVSGLTCESGRVCCEDICD